MATECNRRDFVKGAVAGVTAATLTARSYARVLGANDRIQIGQIGCGSRGIGVHMAGINKHGGAEKAEITAVCDPWSVVRENANGLVKEWYGHEAKQFVSYRDLLGFKDLDAVMIASCDHHHATQLEAAAKAGKHVYVEKPMARNMKELLASVDAVKAAGVTVQVGTQIRSLPTSEGCRRLYNAGAGVLGKASRIDQYRNSEQPYWYGYLREVRKEDVVWEEFLMNAPKRAFDPHRYSGWYGYMDYTDGPVTNLGVHFIDLMHYITGAGYPESCVCMEGVFTWKDEYAFDCADHTEALWTYPEGFIMAYSTNFGNGSGKRLRIFTEKGVLNLDNWAAPTYSAEGGPKRDGNIRGVKPVEEVEGPDHIQDWLQCMRSGKKTRASIEDGYHQTVVGLMAVEAAKHGRMRYDHNKRQIFPG
jgi:predicted dehydrogenase